MSSELERIELLRTALDAGVGTHVSIGIGDDAAVLSGPDQPLVWTVDAAVEGVHFRRDLISLEDVGYRATMAAASDLAAMGATPLGLLAALVLPPWVTDADLEAIARGQRDAAVSIGTAVIGGNLARGTELSITTTALGSAPRPMTRSGARVGDEIRLSGPVGLAAAGLAALDRRVEESLALASAISAWRRPRARIAEGLRANAAGATAAIDVSDGLARDLAHVARASRVRAVLDVPVVTGPDLVRATGVLGMDALALALHGGEDYALIIAMPPGQPALQGFARIGVFGAPVDGSHVALRDAEGRVTPAEEGGFDHFGRE